MFIQYNSAKTTKIGRHHSNIFVGWWIARYGEQKKSTTSSRLVNRSYTYKLAIANLAKGQAILCSYLPGPILANLDQIFLTNLLDQILVLHACMQFLYALN